MAKKQKILAIGAHPDDIEYYAGATLSRFSAIGYDVTYIIATDGEKGGDPRMRIAELERAGHILGVKRYVYLKYPDGELEYNIKLLKEKILKIILAERPNIIFSFDPHNQFVVHKDFHPDHRALAVSVVDVALIDATLAGVRRPKLWLYNPYRFNRKNNFRLHILKKFLALGEYKSQNVKDATRTEKFRLY
ncbi:hypothetical protein A2872_01795 [Candidatus Gottesmanbacteria bacterium RIFCSPHIGHO2_01_FULL_42_12]|uniref:PIG-L family deacetylase n=1 Tax=Candidatus Gottesmanbacteria bacterium RIFCSPHIGHO2_01_FULL_42_12 TaxID=1798377 RepID=A0A1F5Z5K4_9BACT|nr:MAG: hypothetical protein A2872_01795 [Candidatus Gottesmanbacteria bacterium RIFCSPHIGHO2_01_FULL_42_12]